jgi:hypothetical protein
LKNDKIAAALEAQIHACDVLGSPLTKAVLEICLDDFLADGIVATLTRGWAGDPLDDNVPLRLAGFIHFSALGGDVGLRPHFESCGGTFQATAKTDVARAVLDCFTRHEGDARRFFRRTPQTNETGRAGVLLLGFSEIARRTGLPLNLAEMGASAGLNLLFDKFNYQIETTDGLVTWGPADSALSISSHWRGAPPPPLQGEIEIAARAGCDLFPVIISDAQARRALEAWVWGDMSERRARLLAALSIADKAPPELARADAAGWVAAQIMNRPRGQTTVLYHSLVWPYLDVSQRMAIESSFAQAGETVTPDTPLAWLKMDHDHIQSFSHLSYRLWTGANGPEGEQVFIGPCHPHGADIELRDVFARD